jgi:hypothetical protein
MRISVVNWRTTERDIALTIEAVSRVLAIKIRERRA